MIIILDINKLKKENYKMKIFNEKIKQQNEKTLLKLSLLNDAIFNNHNLITKDMYFQRTNLFELIDKIDKVSYLMNKNNEKLNKNVKEDVKNEETKNEETKKEETKNEETKNEETKNEDFDDELLNEGYDILPCNNLNKITSTGKYFFKFF
jgi:hypothetical protein